MFCRISGTYFFFINAYRGACQLTPPQRRSCLNVIVASNLRAVTRVTDCSDFKSGQIVGDHSGYRYRSSGTAIPNLPPNISNLPDATTANFFQFRVRRSDRVILTPDCCLPLVIEITSRRDCRHAWSNHLTISLLPG